MPRKKQPTKRNPMPRNLQLCLNAIDKNDKQTLVQLISQDKELVNKIFDLDLQIEMGGVYKVLKVKADLLLHAVCSLNLEMVKFLVEKNAPLKKNYEICSGLFTYHASLLFCSLYFDYKEEISLYLSTLPGIDVNAGGKIDGVAGSPLFLACKSCLPVAINLLERDEIEIEQQFQSKDIANYALIKALQMFAMAESKNKLTENHTQLIEKILEKYQSKSAQIPPDCFHYCCMCIKDTHIAELFIKFGIDPTLATTYSFLLNKNGNQPLATYNALHCAVATKNQKLVEHLITKYPVTVSGRSQCYLRDDEKRGGYLADMTGLMIACAGGDLDDLNIAKLIIDSNDASIFESVYLLPIYTPTGELKPIKPEEIITPKTVFHFACESESLEFITYLLDKINKANTDTQTKINHIQSGFSYLIRQKKEDFFHLFKNHLNQNVYVKHLSGITEKFSPLAGAIKFTSWETAKQLIELGAKINPSLELATVDQPSKTKMLATLIDWVDIIVTALSRKSSGKEETKAIHEKFDQALDDVKKYFLELENHHCTQSHVKVGCYPLAVAIESRQRKIFDELIKLKADPTLPIDINADVSYSLLALIPMLRNDENSLNEYLTALLAFWEENFRDYPIPGLSPIISCILHEKPLLLKTLLQHPLLQNDPFVLYKEITLELVMQRCPYSTEIVIVFIEAGYPVNELLLFRDGLAPLLLMSIFLNNKKLYKALLKHGADIHLAGNLSDAMVSSFWAACVCFEYDRFYLTALLTHRFKSKENTLATDYLNKTNDPVGAAVMADDVDLLSDLLKNGFELHDKIEELASSNQKAEIMYYLIKNKGKSNFFLIEQISKLGYRATQPCKNNYQRFSTKENDITYLEWLKSQLNTFFNLLINDSVQKVQASKHFVLFRFFETLNEWNQNFEVKTKNRHILRPKTVSNLRNILAHQYRYLDNQDFQELLNLSKNLQTFIENPQTVISDPDIDKPFIKFLIKMTSKIKDDDQILTPIETIKKVLEKMELILKNMPTKLLLIDHPSVLGLQECIYQIGECYQSINKTCEWKDEKTRITHWSDETGMGVFAVMEAARFIRRALSHEIEEDVYADDFNPYYLEWLGNDIVSLMPNIKTVLNNIEEHLRTCSKSFN